VDVNVREFFYAYDWPGNVRELEYLLFFHVKAEDIK
ncbi:hypothetical protein ACT4UM_15805, partial [Bacillus sp. SS-TM]